MDEFLKTTRQTSRKIERLEKYVLKMKCLITDKTNNILNEKKEKKQNYKIDAANKIFRKKSAEINTLIHEMRDYPEDSNTLGNKTKDLQIKNLSLRFSNVLNDYREVQVLNGNLEIERTKNEYLIMNPQASSNDVLEYLNSHGKTKKSAFAVGSEKSSILNRKIEKRHKRIKDISENAIAIAELIQTNKDLVFSQRKVVDAIEINIEETAEDVEQGTQNLEEAQEYQRRANSIRDFIIKIVIWVVIIGVIGFVLFIFINKSGSTN